MKRKFPPADASTDPAPLLREGFQALGLTPTPSMLLQFGFYHSALRQWNTRINLTGLKTTADVVTRHFLDSLAVWPWVQHLDSLADIGTGAGFPGLPLKLLFPNLRLTLVEPTGKKTAFLHYVVAHLGLSAVEIRPAHLTPALARQWGPRFQGVITRATFPLGTYLEMCAPLVQPGGVLLALKGPNLDAAEWRQAEAGASRHQFHPPAKHVYALPLSSQGRCVVIWEKQLLPSA